MLEPKKTPTNSAVMRSLRLNPGVHHSGDGLSLVKLVERSWSGLGVGAAGGSSCGSWAGSGDCSATKSGATISAPQEKQNRLSATGTAAPHRIQNLAGWDMVHLLLTHKRLATRKPNPDCLLSHAGWLRHGYNNPQWLPDSKV